MKILLIEDDQNIGEEICTGLTSLGLTVDWFTDGLEGQQALLVAKYNAVILDLGLPSVDGLQILKYWRHHKYDTPVVILSARDTISDKVNGLQCGADDYLCKPFALAELAARLQTVVRRYHGHCSSYLKHQNISLNQSNRQVTKEGKVIPLTTKEITLFEHFLLNKNKVLSRETLQNLLYSWQDDVTSNTIDVHIYNLRKKIGDPIIRTIYGEGYLLEEIETE